MKGRIFWMVLLLFCVELTCSGWGFLVHKTTVQLAIYQLPRNMRPFFFKYMDSLVQKSILPDLRRSANPTEPPKHFIDLEDYGDSAAWKMPPDWSQAILAFGRDKLEKKGYLPYAIMITRQNLTHAFRQGNKDSILAYAADLAHYIGDAHVPLHVTANYDGQFTHQPGLHALWESLVPEMEFSSYAFYEKHEARFVQDPAERIWEIIQHTAQGVPEVFEAERLTARQFPDSIKYRILTRNGRSFRSYTAEFAKSYGQNLGPAVRQQLLATVTATSDFWYTSWVEAGKPDLDKLPGAEFVRKDKRELKKQRKAYRRGLLMENKSLIGFNQSKAIQE